jgi:hypothetical protein
MVMMVVMVVICRYHHLRLRRDRSREAEDNKEPEEKLFHGGLDEDSQRGITKPPQPARSRGGFTALFWLAR